MKNILLLSALAAAVTATPLAMPQHGFSMSDYCDFMTDCGDVPDKQCPAWIKCMDVYDWCHEEHKSPSCYPFLDPNAPPESNNGAPAVVKRQNGGVDETRNEIDTPKECRAFCEKNKPADKVKLCIKDCAMRTYCPDIVYEKWGYKCGKSPKPLNETECKEEKWESLKQCAGEAPLRAYADDYTYSTTLTYVPPSTATSAPAAFTEAVVKRDTEPELRFEISICYQMCMGNREQCVQRCFRDTVCPKHFEKHAGKNCEKILVYDGAGNFLPANFTESECNARREESINKCARMAQDTIEQVLFHGSSAPTWNPIRTSTGAPSSTHGGGDNAKRAITSLPFPLHPPGHTITSLPFSLYPPGHATLLTKPSPTTSCTKSKSATPIVEIEKRQDINTPGECRDSYLSCRNGSPEGSNRELICRQCWRVCSEKGPKACSVCKWFTDVDNCPAGYHPPKA